MKKIIDDYIKKVSLFQSEFLFLNSVKDNIENYQNIIELFEFFIDKNEIQYANDVLDKLSANINIYPSLLYPAALVKMNLDLNNEACFFFEKYFEIETENNEAKFNYAVVLGKLDKLNEAIKILNQIKEKGYINADLFLNLGGLYFLNGEIDKSIEAYKTSITLDPKNADAYYNLGSLLEGKREFVKSLKYYTKALGCNKNHIQAKWNRSLLHLREGNYIEGFRDFEVRLQKNEIIRDDLPFPEWDGKNLTGKTIFVYQEQGYGDFFQNARFLKLLKTKFSKVILEINPELKDIVESVQGVDSFHLAGTKICEKVDCKVAIMSLPFKLKIELNNLINNTPYIYPTDERVKAIERKFKAINHKIGFVWTGNKIPVTNNIRHTKLNFFTNLAKKFPEITFLSLQVGEENHNISRLNIPNLVDVSEEIKNFNDTAAIIKNLDLLITIDTSVAHLGGAVGTETWLLLSYLPDWRWLLGKKRSSWYPCIKQYRQGPEGSWEQIFSEVENDLQRKFGKWNGNNKLLLFENKIEKYIKEKNTKGIESFLKEDNNYTVNNYRLLSLLGGFFEENRDFEQADIFYQKSFELKKVDFENLNKYISFLFRQNKLSKCKKLLKIALNMFPVEAEFYYLTALLFYYQNKKEEYNIYFNKAEEKTGCRIKTIEHLKSIIENGAELKEEYMKQKPKLTLSMIIKNEEKYLDGCLASVKGLVDEIVIVDTGSTDRSLEIAKKYCAKIFHFNWVSDFSAARNYALENSTGEWVLYLDADERLIPESVPLVKNIITQNNKLGVYCNVISYSEVAGNTNNMKYTRLFKNSDNIKFKGRVHEQIEVSLAENNYNITDSNISIEHIGYNQSEDIYKQKAERNLELLLLDYKQKAAAYTAFQIGQTYIVLGKTAESIKYFKKVLADPDIDEIYHLESARFLAAFYNSKNESETALEYVKTGLKINPEHHLLNIILAEIFLKTGNKEKTEIYFLKGYKTNNQLIAGEINSILDYAIEKEKIIIRGIQFALFIRSKNLLHLMKQEAKNYSKNTYLIQIIEQLECLFEIEKCNKEINSSNRITEIISSEMILTCINLNENIFDQEALLKKFESFYQKDLNYQSYYANILFVMKKYEESLIKYESLHNKIKDNPEIFLKLIAVNFNLRNIEKIKTLLEKGLELYKTYPTVIEQINNIKKKI